MGDGADPFPDRKTLVALIEASQAILGRMDLQDVLLQIADRAAAVLDAECASVQLLDAERKQLVFRASTGPGADGLIGQRFDATLGIAGQAIRTRRPVRVDDVRQNLNFFDGIDTVTQFRTRNLLAAPLIHADEVLGVVEVLNTRGRAQFADRDLELLQLFSNLAATAASAAQTFDRVRRENAGLREAMPAPHQIGASAGLRRVRALCHKVAATDMTVLLCGETGSGKEVAAREVHAASPRQAKPFIAVNCAALSEHLVESELFGHEKGAFTGATGQKPGRFELADGGTLFLDEIGEMPAPLQAKLLRAVEERACVRVGGTRPVSFDVRLIAATNRDLKREAEAGRFRQDLYYRLSVFPIELPPLRLRVEDVRPLAEHFLGRIAPSLGAAAAGPRGVSEAAMACLTGYHWPGNIRELRNVIERGALLAGGQPIAPEHLPPEIAAAAARAPAVPPGGGGGGSKLGDQERSLLVEALEQSGWNQSAAARRLRITRDCCRSRMKKYGLSISGGDPPTSAG